MATVTVTVLAVSLVSIATVIPLTNKSNLMEYPVKPLGAKTTFELIWYTPSCLGINVSTPLNLPLKSNSTSVKLTVIGVPAVINWVTSLFALNADSIAPDPVAPVGPVLPAIPIPVGPMLPVGPAVPVGPIGPISGKGKAHGNGIYEFF